MRMCTQAWHFFEFFCRNRNLMVPRACNTRLLKIRYGRDIRLLNISAYAQPEMKSIPRTCSASNEICSAYAQCAMKLVPHMLSMDLHVKTVHILPLAEHAPKLVPCMLSVRWNRFLVCSVCNKIISVYAQDVQAIIFENYLKIPN